MADFGRKKKIEGVDGAPLLHQDERRWARATGTPGRGDGQGLELRWNRIRTARIVHLGPPGPRFPEGQIPRGFFLRPLRSPPKARSAFAGGAFPSRPSRRLAPQGFAWTGKTSPAMI